VNIHVKGLLREQGVKLDDKTVYTGQTEARQFRRVPQSRVISRLELSGYPTELDDITELAPKEVRIALKHGVGKPASPLVSPGDHVEAGGLIAGVDMADVGAQVHASVSGTVLSVDAGGVTIRNEGGGGR
jgi:Na+-translocating ferredoxin:NAD+ oxidoreductase RnfC subunit